VHHTGMTIRSYLLLALIGSASAAGKCAPGDASCPGQDQSILLQTHIREHEQTDDEDEQVPKGTCARFQSSDTCPAGICEWFDGRCEAPCNSFKNKKGDNCPSRCDFSNGVCKQPGVKNIGFSGKGDKAKQSWPTAEPPKVSKQLNKKYGPGADLILSLPMAIQNLTKFSTEMFTATENKGIVKSKYKFGDVDGDKARLLDLVSGFWKNLLADKNAKALGATEKCPKGRISAIKPCVEMGLCLVQSHLNNNKAARKTYSKVYSMLEQLAAGYQDISAGILTTAMKLEDGSLVQEDVFNSDGSLAQAGKDMMEDSFLEASSYACSTGASALFQEDDSEHTEVRAAAYHTSAVLQAAAKETHAVLDSHTQNSSAEATLAALRQAWKPSCELLNCDHTNYFDLYGASHSHSLALIEAGASGQHMRTHIRTRHRLEVRLQRFLGEHGAQFLKDGKLAMYQVEGTTTEARIKHYTSMLREELMNFADEHSKTKTEDELFELIDKDRMKEFYEDRQVEDGQAELHENDNNDPSTEIAEEHDIATLAQEDGSELDTVLSESAEEDTAAGRRRRRWLRRRRRRWVIAKIVKVVVKAVNTAWKFIMDCFACAGKVALMYAGGYGKKFPLPTSYAGVGCAFSMSYSISSLGTFLQGRMVEKISFSIGLVTPVIPWDAISGGVRSGVGISGSIGCGTTGCTVGISVGAVVAGLIANNDPKCVAGRYLFGLPPTGWGCFTSGGVAISAMCCSHNFVTGSSNCR